MMNLDLCDIFGIDLSGNGNDVSLHTNIRLCCFDEIINTWVNWSLIDAINFDLFLLNGYLPIYHVQCCIMSNVKPLKAKGFQ